MTYNVFGGTLNLAQAPKKSLRRQSKEKKQKKALCLCAIIVQANLGNTAMTQFTSIGYNLCMD